MLAFDKYPAKLERQTEYGKYSVEVFGWMEPNIFPIIPFSLKTPQSTKLVLFRQTAIPLTFDITMLPIAEFEEKFKDYKLVK